MTAAALVFVGALWAGCGPEVAQPGPAPVTDPSELVAPPSGQGVQLLTQAFEVPSGQEVQACYFYKVSDLLAANGMDPTQPLELHHIQMVIRPGSHHMNAVPGAHDLGPRSRNGSPQVGINGVGQCFVSSNWSRLAAHREHAGRGQPRLDLPGRRRERDHAGRVRS